MARAVNAGSGIVATNASFASTAPAAPTAAPVITEGDLVNVVMDENGDPTAFSLTLHATDPDTPSGDVITWSATGGVAGHPSAEGTGLSVAVTYTPNAYYAGADAFVVRATDASGNTDTILVTVTIKPAAGNEPGRALYIFE